MSERNLQTELNNRIKPAVLSKVGRPHRDCTDVKVDGRTWKYGMDFINQDGSHVYNGVSWTSLDTKLTNKEPKFVPDNVYEAVFQNKTKETQKYQPTLSKTVSVTDTTTFSFQESIKLGVSAEFAVSFHGTGVKAKLSAEAGFIATQTVQSGKTESVTQGMSA